MDSVSSVPASIAVKLFYKDEIHRFEIKPATLAVLRAEIEKIFPSESFAVSYTDDEGDNVMLRTENEMSHALSLVKAPLRIRVTQLPPTAPPTPVLPSDVAKPLQVAKQEFREKVAEAKSSVQAAKHALKNAKAEFKQEVKKGLRQWGQYQREQQRAQSTPDNRQPVVVRQLDSRFVQHVAGKDDAQYAPNVTFVKTFRFRNIGSSVWHPQIRLLLVSLVNHLSSPTYVELGREVAPDEEVDIAVTLRTPEKLGAYDAFFRLATVDGRKFGQRVRCRIQVTNSPVVDSSSSPDTSDSLSSSSSSGDDSDDSESSSDSSSSSAEESSDDKKKKVKAAAASPAAPQPPLQTEFQPQLEQLVSMGFVDRDLNIRLLNKCIGDLHATVKKLMKKKFKVMLKEVHHTKKSLKKAKKHSKHVGKKDAKSAKRAVKLEAKKSKKEGKQEKKMAKKQAVPTGVQPSGETVVFTPVLPVEAPALLVVATPAGEVTVPVLGPMTPDVATVAPM